MTKELWDQPVELKIDNADHFQCVSSTRDAIAILAASWPSTHDTTYARARRICLKAASGKATSDEAYAAFLKAAEEAGILKH
jgi:hypothetical protein